MNNAQPIFKFPIRRSKSLVIVFASSIMQQLDGVYVRTHKFLVFTNYIISNDIVPKKCPIESTEARKQGNELYKKKNHDPGDHKQILFLFNKSVAFAPYESEQLALAYSNRSALLLHIKDFDGCLLDIERAVNITRSNELKSKLHCRRNKCYNEMKNINQKLQKEQRTLEDCFQDSELEIYTSKSLKSLYSMFNETSSIPSIENNDEILQLPKMSRSSEIPCFSESISLKYSNKWGRHIIATRDIEPGEVIVIEDCYLVSPLNEAIYIHCNHCLELATNGIPCDYCPFAVYCSKKCKEEAFIMYHDVECYLVSLLNTVEKLKNVSLCQAKASFRLFITLLKNEPLHNIITKSNKMDSNPKYFHSADFMLEKSSSKEIFMQCYNLSSHTNDVQMNRENSFVALLFINMLHMIQQSRLLLEIPDNFLENEGVGPRLQAIFAKLKNAMTNNSFDVGDVCGCTDVEHLSCNKLTIGNCLIVYSSFFNHNCSPNVASTFIKNRKNIFHTIKPVKKGEQLFVSYCLAANAADKRSRQSLLKRNFNFTCDCEPCTDNWPLSDILQIMHENKKEYISLIKVLEEASNESRNGNLEPFFLNPSAFWSFNEKTLNYVIQMIKIVYKNCKNYTADLITERFREYLFRAYKKWFQVQYDVTDECSEL